MTPNPFISAVALGHGHNFLRVIASATAVALIALTAGCGGPPDGTARSVPPASEPVASPPVVRRSMEKFLAGSVFVSKTLHDGGLGPTGPVQSHWRITFRQPGYAAFAYSDVEAGFRYRVLNDGRLRVWLADRPVIAVCNVPERELTLEGIVYAMEPTQAATRPTTLPAHDPPLTQAEMDAIFTNVTFSKEHIIDAETPRIKITLTRLHAYRGKGTWNTYYLELRARHHHRQARS